MSKNKGLIVSVLRDADGTDCTNNGESVRFTRFTLTGEGVSGPFSPVADRPELVVMRKNVGGSEYIYARPTSIPEGRWSMFGGNFVYTSDSRFRDICPYPIPVHDRVEG